MSNLLTESVISVRHEDWSRWHAVATVWDRVAASSPYASVFTSAAWTGTWLESFGPLFEPSLLVVENAGEPVGCCLLVPRRKRYAGIPVRRLYLNAAGEDNCDDTCIEYNSLLCRAGFERQTASAVSAWMQRHGWDEFHLNGCADTPATAELLAAFPEGSVHAAGKPSHFVDLTELRKAGRDYDDVLSSNTRQQIRRSLRLYEERGPVTLTRMQSRSDAMECLGELARLHVQSWNDRGRPGVFSSERFMAFHSRYVASVFHTGAVALYRVTGGEQTIGVLYHLIDNGRVRFYQSGFAYESNARLKPGLVTHYLSIKHSLEVGLLEYDFLAGDAQYKRSLATHCRRLTWYTVERSTAPVRMVRALRGLREELRRISKRAR